MVVAIKFMLLDTMLFIITLGIFLQIERTVYCAKPSLVDEQRIVIHKSANDENAYSYKVLSNGLKVLFITNEDIQRSCCSISMQTGSSDDTIHGIAHLLEHMLFEGNAKYPLVNGWDDFLNLHGGSTNASTDVDITTYFFDIPSEHFLDALDRFCEFFVSPIFDTNAIEYEIEAIDSDFRFGKMNDYIRLYRLLNVMSTDKHNKFACGNKDTLAVPSIREELIKFWKENYTSDEMCLVIYHNSDIEDEVSEMFSRIPNRNKSRRVDESSVFGFEKKLFKDKNMNRIIHVKSITDIQILGIYIEIPKHKYMFRDSTYSYLTLLLNISDKGSLTSILSDLGYVTDVSISTGYYLDYSLIVLEFALTDLGCDEFGEVVSTIKSYLKNLAGSRNHYREFKKYMRMAFEKWEHEMSIDTVYALSNDMQYFPIENLLDNNFLCEKYNTREMALVLKMINDSNNWLVFVIKKGLELDGSMTEEYYGIEYKVSETTLQ